MREGKILQFPHQGPDIKEVVRNGKPEKVLSARGVLLFFLSAWKLDGNEKAHNCLRRYCEYIAAHGCKGGASQLLAELDSLDRGEDAAWIRRTFAQYVQDQTALMQYVLQT